MSGSCSALQACVHRRMRIPCREERILFNLAGNQALGVEGAQTPLTTPLIGLCQKNSSSARSNYNFFKNSHNPAFSSINNSTSIIVTFLSSVGKRKTTWFNLQQHFYRIRLFLVLSETNGYWARFWSRELLSILLVEVDSSDIWSLVFGDLCISSETSWDSPDEEFSLWGRPFALVIVSLLEGSCVQITRLERGWQGRKKYWRSGSRDKLSTFILITKRGLLVTRRNLENRGMGR